MTFSLLPSLSPVLLVLLKATAVLLVALLMTALMSRASATSRHLVWVASLCAVLVMPALALWSPVRLALLPAAWAIPAALPTVVAESPEFAAPDNPRAEPRTAQPAASSVASTPRDLNATAAATAAGSTVVEPSRTPLEWIAWVWAAVAAGIVGWLLVGARNVRRIIRGAEVLSATEWQSAMIDIADRLELDSTPRLLRSDRVTMPFACGLRIPTIVLPGECAAWSAERRSAVLLHELAHIRRRDIIGHTLGRVACALYWFHPLVWTAARRLRAESERACDDLALSCGTRPSDYAEHLLDIVTSVRAHATPSVAMAMATRSEFEGRMLAILDPSLLRAAPTRVQASTLAGGVMMFAIITGSAVPRPLPPTGPRQPGMTVGTLIDSVETALLVAGADTARRVREEPAPAPDPVPAPDVAGRADSLVQSEIDVDVHDGDSRDEARGVERTTMMDRVAGSADSSARTIALARILRTDSAAALRRTAAWGLHPFANDAVARDALLAAVRRDPSADVREMAAWALSDVADQRQVATVLADAVAQERDRSVRETAVWSLSSSASNRSPESLSTLTAVLRDDDATVREMAAWGLGSAGPRRAPAALVALLADRDARVRATTAWALFQIEDDATADALDAALQKEIDQDARWAMVRAISVMGDRAVAPLQRIIESSDAPLRALAIRALAGRGSDPWPRPRPRPRPFP
jgi:beta-lactamase regulating signal transducer with metallopeptidase domain